MQCACAILCFVGLSFVVHAEEEEMLPLLAAPSPYDTPLQAEIAQLVEMAMMNRETATQDLTSYLQFRLNLSSEQEQTYGERLVDDMIFLVESDVLNETVTDTVAEEVLNFENMLDGEQIVVWQTAKDAIRKILNDEKIAKENMPINNDIVIHTEAEAQLYMKQNNVTPTSLFMPDDDDSAGAASDASVVSIEEMQTRRK